jgi:hypothetical protein
MAKIVTEPLAVASGCQTQPPLKYSWQRFTLIILDISYCSEQLLFGPEIPATAATNPGLFSLCQQSASLIVRVAFALNAFKIHLGLQLADTTV